MPDLAAPSSPLTLAVAVGEVPAPTAADGGGPPPRLKAGTSSEVEMAEATVARRALAAKGSSLTGSADASEAGTLLG